MPQRIQILRGTTGEWTTDDVVLLLGELGTDTTTGIVKIGDGTSTWSALDGTTLLPATTTAVGGVELATDAETITGTAPDLAVTPAGLAAASTLAPVTVSGTTDTLAAADNGKVNIYTEATLVTVVLTDLDAGHETLLVAAGAAGITLDTTGMTLIGSSPSTTAAQDESIYVKKTATANTWLVVGPAAATGGDTGTNIDGGAADTTYGGTVAIDGGTAA